MELEDFIRSSVLQIMGGIKAAQSEWDTSHGSGGGVINPAWEGPDDFINRVQEVKFDIAVTVTGKNESGGGGGIKVIALDVSGKTSHSTENSTVSRIAFSIPILPSTTVILKQSGTEG
jgi:hypothetical protein